MHLHLRIDDDLAGAIEIQLHGVTHLECLRVQYEELGGEAYNSRRRRTRHAIAPGVLAEIETLLPNEQLPAPANISAAAHETAYTLTIGRGSKAVEYHWMSGLPTEWAPLRRIVQLLLEAAQVDFALSS